MMHTLLFLLIGFGLAIVALGAMNIMIEILEDRSR